MNVKECLAYTEQHKVEMVDLKFCDVPGLWQHFSIPVSAFAEDIFEQGIGFDGSSIRGFQSIHESDMLLVPDPDSAFLDPFTDLPTLSLICNVQDPVTGQRYSRDPRYVAHKAEQHLKSSGIADVSYWGPEIEFYIFDNIRFDQTYNQGFYHVDSVEGFWNSGDEARPNLGYKPRYKEGYFPVPPMDHMQNLRSEMVRTLQQVGIEVEVHHHEVGTAGQAEIDMRFKSLTRMADQVLMYKYVVKNVARAHGRTVTMMPKPIFMDNGSGMHTHQSLWKSDKNVFYDPGRYGLISEMARHYIGGILAHADALCAFIAPTTNSYRRLVPGYEAPVNIVYSQRNRSACVRIPMYSSDENSKRIEFRTPDASCNPYYAFSAMLMAGLDGIERKIEPPDPMDKDLYDLGPEEQRDVKLVAGSLEAALDALERDHDFLLKDEVFTEDTLENWLTYKRAREVEEIRLRPHPYEFALYYDI
ncbi:MAG: type I glutamate--ammonia ligase [Gammaproteobacteria bacterium]|nr:type I glutamate--ammonia ligase [Gammaproteobacteria bacterium]NIR85039.1 type I glutamate--ammonia ligase [Gammaproteobacteria bacterium]NIR88306.1 type I glutamate--ammonia ligase [Gammaproteobacteria bacterium]NIU06086.1 type I glutamate--ammonia ligase [Gammaproteobacteria bacterium]NIV73505.1 type I glutamate--ammonia ligase [Gammaproteobacteria bacterium]